MGDYSQAGPSHEHLAGRRGRSNPGKSRALIPGKELTRADGGKHPNTRPEIESTKSGLDIVQIRGTGQA